jgi:hypothetical protein
MEYKTSDIVLASYLRLSGNEITRIEKVGMKGTFVFTNIDDDLIQAYDFGRARVEPVAFNNTIKSLTTAVRRMD